jgi:hypothetical protein
MTYTDDKKYRFFINALLGLWLASATIASASGAFRAGARDSYAPLSLGLAVLAPILAFLAYFAASSRFRDFVFALNVRTLTIVQSWRLGGFVFLVLYTHGILPGVFALPAGWGDMFIGATAALAANHFTREKGRKKLFIAWQLLGVLDLVMALTLGVLTSRAPVGILARGITSDAMTTLPLSLIPTFAVPLLFIFHLISIAQASRWPATPMKEAGHNSLQASAA